MAKKKRAATSAQVNAYIKRQAASAANWDALAAGVRALGYPITTKAVILRGQNMGVTTKGRKLKGLFAQPPTADLPGDPLENKLAELLKKRKALQTVETLANSLDVSPFRVAKAMEALKARGHNVVVVAGNVEYSRDIPKQPPMRIDVRKLQGKVFRFGVTADNHLCSRYQRLDVLNACFDEWERQGIQTVYQAGNMIDGEARFNKTDLLVHGMDAQCRYFAENWPKRKGMTTYFVTGDDHEGWYVQREGVNIGHYLQDTARNLGRKDLVYLGHMEHDIHFTGSKHTSTLRIIHAGGGSAYATSYTVQKIVESYQGGEKPNVLIAGHYHKAEVGYPREVHCIQPGCTMDQSPFMRKKKLQAHVGAYTVEMTINDLGIITKFKTEFMPFYDLGFYDKAWQYRGAA